MELCEPTEAVLADARPSLRGSGPPADRASALILLAQGGAGTPEGSGGRRVGFVELDVSAAGARAAQGVIRVEFGRVDSYAGLRQPDDELVIAARFAVVPGGDDPVDVTEQIRPGRSTDEPGTGRLTVGARARVDLHVRRDAGPVNVQVHAVVDVLQMPPGRRAVLASAPDAEVGLGARIPDDETTARQEVALPGTCRSAGEHQPERGDSKRITSPNAAHCLLLHSLCDDFGKPSALSSSLAPLSRCRRSDPPSRKRRSRRRRRTRSCE